MSRRLSEAGKPVFAVLTAPWKLALQPEVGQEESEYPICGIEVFFRKMGVASGPAGYKHGKDAERTYARTQSTLNLVDISACQQLGLWYRQAGYLRGLTQAPFQLCDQ